MIKASQTGPILSVRLVNSGEVNESFRSASRWLGTNKKIIDPLILYYKTRVPTLTILGKSPFSEFINLDKVPKDFILSRQDSGARSGVMFMDSGTIIVRFYFTRKKMMGLQEALFESVQETLKNEYNIETMMAPWKRITNDMVFVKDGKNKKFMGVAYASIDNYFAFTFLLQFNKEKIEGLYKLDHPKFLAKGGVNDISDVVGGLKEANPDIDESVIPKILIHLAQKMRWELKEDVLNEEEKDIIENTIMELSKEETKDWILTGKD